MLGGQWKASDQRTKPVQTLAAESDGILTALSQPITKFALLQAALKVELGSPEMVSNSVIAVKHIQDSYSCQTCPYRLPNQPAMCTFTPHHYSH